MANFWREARRWIAAAVAPLCVFPLVLAGMAHGSFQIEGHWEKFWSGEWLLWIGMAYVGSAAGAIPARFLAWLLRISPSILSVTATYVASCTAILFVFLLASAAFGRRPPLSAVFVGPALIAIPCTVVGVAYGLVAGLPWRGPRAEPGAARVSHPPTRL